MAGEGLDEGVNDQWVFTEQALAHVRETARSKAVQVLQGAVAEGGDRRAGSREPPKPLELEEALRLVFFYAQKIPELCDLCGAPPEVQWTAVVFYQRFFAVRSPMEFDPLPFMFACVHAACKVEEAREVTLDRLLEAADSGADGSLRARVERSELPLLEALGFRLLVEPKPRPALRVLAGELRAAAGAAAPAAAVAAAALPEGEEAWREALARAEGLAMELAVRTDAALRWPASVGLAAALGAALDARAPAGGAAEAPSRAVAGFLRGSLGTEAQRAAAAEMFEAALRRAEGLASEPRVAEGAVRETAKSARRCQRAFERLRELAAESSEAQRKERKRKLSEAKGAERHQAPAPLLRELMDFNRRMQAGLGGAAVGSGGAAADVPGSPHGQDAAYD